jgi:hypothetical protein
MWINNVYPTLQRHIPSTQQTIQVLQEQGPLPPTALTDVLNLRDTLGYLTLSLHLAQPSRWLAALLQLHLSQVNEAAVYLSSDDAFDRAGVASDLDRFLRLLNEFRHFTVTEQRL